MATATAARSSASENAARQMRARLPLPPPALTGAICPRRAKVPPLPEERPDGSAGTGDSFRRSVSGGSPENCCAAPQPAVVRDSPSRWTAAPPPGPAAGTSSRFSARDSAGWATARFLREEPRRRAAPRGPEKRLLRRLPAFRPRPALPRSRGLLFPGGAPLPSEAGSLPRRAPAGQQQQQLSSFVDRGFPEASPSQAQAVSPQCQALHL